MDREIDMPTGWMSEWLTRTHSGLRTYSTLTYNILSIAAVVLGIRAILRLRQTRRELIADPSSRASIFSASSAKIHSLTKRQFYLATIFLLHALAFYSVDTAISATALWDDASENPMVYDRAMILALAVYTIGMLAIFTAVFLLFPMAQILLCFTLLGKFHRNRENTSATLAEYIPEARILSTHVGQIWSMLAFVLMAYWPMSESPITRVLLVEAVFGSGVLWLQLSYGLNFRVKQFEGIEVRELLASKESITKYGTQMFSARTEVLPVYESVAQTEQSLDEKAGA